MITSQQISVPKGPASTARQRLLQDSQMRCNKAARPTPPLSITYTMSTPAVIDEQEEQAIAIARTYKEHYLADISYHSSRCEIVALLKPMRKDQTPLHIFVDADGNAAVEAFDSPSEPTFKFALGRLLLVFLAVFTATLLLVLAGIY